MTTAMKNGSTARRLERRSLLEIGFLMRLAREWDLRFENLARTGGIGKWYSAVGNEATTVGAAAALAAGDALVTIHRDVGAILTRSIDSAALLDDLLRAGEGEGRDPAAAEAREYLHGLACQMLGKADGFTGGFDRSYHFGRIDRRRGLVHVGMISHLGAMIPVAAGLALAQSLDRPGGAGPAVTLNFIGDGGTSTGDFHEGLNMAAVWRLPLVLVIENNRYAFSTPEREQFACASLADRGAAYGIPGVAVDGNDPLEVRRVVSEAAARARRGEGPTLIEARLGRLRGHAEGDGSIDVVPDADLERYREADPVPRFEARLVEEGVADAARIEELRARIHGLLVEVTDRALESPAPDPATALAARRVFAPAPAIEETPAAAAPAANASGDPGGATYIEAISRALREEMRRDASVFIMGQDVAEFGGAFRATAGLLEEFGGDRVRNTPLAESGAIGIAVGAALLGLRPVVEMQFADFISCGFNQVVNVAAKTFFRWGGEVPIVIRCPFGGGVGGGPFHSQSPEAWFAHAPGLKVVAPAFPRDALGLLGAAVRDPNPVLYFEHKHLYRRVRECLPEGEVLTPIGRARVVRPGRDASVVAWSWMVHRALAAAERLAAEGIEIEVVDLRTLVPLDTETVLESLARTSRVLIVQEANLTCGFGAEVATRIVSEGFELLDAPVERLAFPDIPIPFAKGLEAACLPDEDKIAGAVRRLVGY